MPGLYEIQIFIFVIFVVMRKMVTMKLVIMMSWSIKKKNTPTPKRLKSVYKLFNEETYFCHCYGWLLRPLIQNALCEFTSLPLDNWTHHLLTQHELNIMRGYQSNSLREILAALLVLV